MVASVSYNQYYGSAIDTQALRMTTKSIFANAAAKSASPEVKPVDVQLYNGEIDALTARQVAMSGAGLQVTLNNNLETAIKFLQTKAAETRMSSKMAEVVSIDSAKKDKQGSNPFYNGQVVDYSKKDEKKSEYLFINVA